MITTARVQVTIEIAANGAWGRECNLEQVFQQAQESAIGQLTQVLGARMGFKIVGKPVVLAVTTSNLEESK